MNNTGNERAGVLTSRRNVFVRSWFPSQFAILSHPRTKVFMFQGGVGGFQEALCFAIPMLSVPIMSDQFHNGLEVETMGYGVNLPYRELNERALIKGMCKLTGTSYLDENSEVVSFNYTSDTSPYKHSVMLMNNALLDSMDVIHPVDKAISWILLAVKNRKMNRPVKLFSSHQHQHHACQSRSALWCIVILLISTIASFLVSAVRRLITHIKVSKLQY